MTTKQISQSKLGSSFEVNLVRNDNVHIDLINWNHDDIDGTHAIEIIVHDAKDHFKIIGSLRMDSKDFVKLVRARTPLSFSSKCYNQGTQVPHKEVN